jgi:hypothetical protein
MDRTEYPELIKRIFKEYAVYKPSYGDVEVELIFDDASGHYELRHLGWDEQRRIHNCILHVDIRGDKIWIQHDGTPEGVATEFLEAGVPAQQIVLAFHAPNERKYTPFAIA